MKTFALAFSVAVAVLLALIVAVKWVYRARTKESLQRQLCRLGMTLSTQHLLGSSTSAYIQDTWASDLPRCPRSIRSAVRTNIESVLSAPWSPPALTTVIERDSRRFKILDIRINQTGNHYDGAGYVIDVKLVDLDDASWPFWLSRVLKGNSSFLRPVASPES